MASLALPNGRNLGARQLWIILLVVAAVIGIIRGSNLRDPRIDQGDTPAYLAAAYHLARHGTFSESFAPGPPAPAVGREPAYPAFLAGLMQIDPKGLGQFTPDCFTRPDRCRPIVVSAQIANIVLFGLSAFLMAGAVLLLPFGTNLSALVAGCYILLNVSAAKWLPWLLSDPLAVFLVSLGSLLTAWAFRRRSPAAWIPVGLCLGVLGLTKAVFLPFTVLAVLTATGLAIYLKSRRVARSALWVAMSFLVVVGPWVARNSLIAGRPQLTDERGGIALSTREALIHMTPREYAASFVFWTGGYGDTVAERLFGEDAISRLRFETPGGFYDIGQHGYHPRVDAKTAQGLSRGEAFKQVDREIISSILGSPVRYVATMAPVFYRGIWIDQFILVGLPALIWATIWAARKRSGVLLAIFSLAWFNLLFYAAVSLNIPRYQLTALPCLALATGLACDRLVRGRLHAAARA